MSAMIFRNWSRFTELNSFIWLERFELVENSVVETVRVVEVISVLPCDSPCFNLWLVWIEIILGMR